MTIVYVDNNATTRMAPEVLEAMMPFFSQTYGNPSSIHSFGGDVAKHIDDARASLAHCLGAENPMEIVFTSGGTESNNTAIRSAVATQSQRRRIVTTRVEHPAILTLVRQLQRDGYTLTELGVDKTGALDLSELQSVISDDVAIVSIMTANNETGVIFPIEAAAEIAHQHGALFHTDGVQAVGKMPFSLKDTAIDMLSVSGHKIYGPKGVGALYIRRGCRFRPFILGGHQERGRRGGTENVPGVIGLGTAAGLAMSKLAEERTRVRALRDRLEMGILEIEDTRLNSCAPELRLPNTTNISFKGVEGEAILLHLNEYGICASSGSACTSGSLEPSHVLRAMGVPFQYAHGSIRFSLGRYNTDADIDRILEVMPSIIKKLRQISPFSYN